MYYSFSEKSTAVAPVYPTPTISRDHRRRPTAKLGRIIDGTTTGSMAKSPIRGNLEGLGVLEPLCVRMCAHVRRTDLWSVATDQRSVLRFGCSFAALARISATLFRPTVRNAGYALVRKGDYKSPRTIPTPPDHALQVGKAPHNLAYRHNPLNRYTLPSRHIFLAASVAVERGEARHSGPNAEKTLDPRQRRGIIRP